MFIVFYRRILYNLYIISYFMDNMCTDVAIETINLLSYCHKIDTITEKLKKNENIRFYLESKAIIYNEPNENESNLSSTNKYINSRSSIALRKSWFSAARSR